MHLDVKSLAGQYVRHRKKLHSDYMDFMQTLCNEDNKYYLPVIMGICSYNEIKQLTFDEFHKISKIARLKLEKESYELFMKIMYK